MDFAHAIAIIITRPLVLRMIDGPVILLDPMVAAVLVRVDDRPITWNGFGQDTVASGFIAMPNHPTALFARFTADDMNDRRSVVVIAAVSWLLIRSTARWIIWVPMGCTFFPPR
jgi:hypothetical protein